MSRPTDPTPLPRAPQPVGRKARSKTDDPQALASGPRKIPLWRKALVWGAMAVLALLALAEFRAQFAYRKNLNVCQEAVERAQGASAAEAKKTLFADIKDHFTSQPEYRVGVHQFAKVGIYSWSWQGLRRYSLRLYVLPEDGTVIDLGSARTWTMPWQHVTAKEWDNTET